MTCVFMLHLLVLYKLLLAANFHETSLRLLLLCWIWFYYSRESHTVSLAHTHAANSCLNSISSEKGFKEVLDTNSYTNSEFACWVCLCANHCCNGQFMYWLVVAWVHALTFQWCSCRRKLPWDCIHQGSVMAMNAIEKNLLVWRVFFCQMNSRG